MEVKKIKSKQDSKGTKDKIIELFFDKHLRPTDIAEKLKVGKSYVTKVIQKDERYNKEKEERRTLLLQIERDNKYLSNRKKISDIEFARCNRGMFEYDDYSSDLVLRKGINVGYNVPKKVSNVVNADSIKSAY